MRIKLKDKIEIIVWSFWILISIVFILLTSYFTSPLYNDYGGDSAIFMLIGKGILAGQVPYVDIFDHKGPVLFFIEALGQSIIPGRLGMCIFEMLCCSISLIVIYNIARCFVNRKLSMIVPFFYLYLLRITLNGGNLSEEYSLPLCLICIWFAIKYAISGNEEHPPKYAFLYGASFMLIALIRINNAVALVSIVLTITIFLCIKKRFNNLFANIIGFIGGMLLIFIPISIYFIVHGAFYEMIRGTFIFNYIYATNIKVKTNVLYMRLALFPCLTGIAGAIVYWLKNRKLLLPVITILISILTFMSIGFGNDFLHYLMLDTIPFVLGVNLIFASFTMEGKHYSIKKNIAPIIAVIILIGTFIVYHRYKNICSFVVDNSSNSKSISVGKYIPSNERNSVFGYNTSAKWFLANDILPCERYFTLQEWWNNFDKSVEGEINEMMEKKPPKWVVVTDIKYLHNKKFLDKIDSNYIPVTEVNDGGYTVTLYKYIK